MRVWVHYQEWGSMVASPEGCKCCKGCDGVTEGAGMSLRV